MGNKVLIILLAIILAFLNVSGNTKSIDVNPESEEFIKNTLVQNVINNSSENLKTKKNREKKKNFSLGKKIEFVISAGISLSKPNSLVAKNTGIADSISQYSDLNSLSYTETGNFKENLIGIPVSLCVNYKLSDSLYLKFGGEYSTMKNSSLKAYNLSWPAISEEINYSQKNSVINMMPFAGIEKRFSSFGIYAVVGFNLTSFNYTNIMKFNDGSYNLESVEEIKARGSGIGINLGAKYMVKLKDRLGIIIKLEYAAQAASSFSGDKITSVSDSLSGNYSTTESGNLYIYDIDPYGMGGFRWWDIHDSSPSGSDVSKVSDFSLKLSSIRFLIGVSF